jgi:hypothetical protein
MTWDDDARARTVSCTPMVRGSDLPVHEAARARVQTASVRHTVTRSHHTRHGRMGAAGTRRGSTNPATPLSSDFNSVDLELLASCRPVAAFCPEEPRPRRRPPSGRIQGMEPMTIGTEAQTCTCCVGAVHARQVLRHVDIYAAAAHRPHAALLSAPQLAVAPIAPAGSLAPPRACAPPGRGNQKD